MTNQEVFDKVVRHLGKQRAKSYLACETVCAYRGAEGRQCAAGPLIPDDVYEPRMEGRNWRDLAQAYPILAAVGDARLIAHLQSVHDNRRVPEWRYMLHEVAKLYELSPIAIDEAFGNVL